MSLSIVTIERRFTAFEVFLNDKQIDVVFHSGCTVEEQKRSLIEHDGYDSEIEVYGQLGCVLPMSTSEKLSLLDDNDVTLFMDCELWRWKDNAGPSFKSHVTRNEAIDDAIKNLNLDTQGIEDTNQ